MGIDQVPDHILQAHAEVSESATSNRDGCISDPFFAGEPPARRSTAIFRGLAKLCLVAIPVGIVCFAIGYRVAGGLTVCYGAMLLAVSYLVIYLRRNSNCWVQDLGDGFSVNNGYRTRSVKDSQIAGISTIAKLPDYWGTPGAVRYLKVWLADQTLPVKIATFVPVGQFDPLANLIARIEGAVAKRALQTLAETGRIDEADWSLSRTQLTIERGTNRETVPIERVTKIDAFDGGICIWLDHSVEPFRGLPRIREMRACC